MTTQTILLVPGLSCTGEVFAPQIAALSGKYTCRVADHRNGRTITDIAGAILARAPERFALVGFSMGGSIALEMVRQAPARIERLALLDAQAAPEAEASRQRRAPLIAMVEDGCFLDAERALWPNVVHPSRYDDEALRAIKMRMAEELGPDLWLQHTRAIMGRPDARSALAEITVPTLILVGDEDRVTPPERAREMADGIAGARLVVVPDCGHMAPIERPEAVNAALAAWMAV